MKTSPQVFRRAALILAAASLLSAVFPHDRSGAQRVVTAERASLSQQILSESAGALNETTKSLPLPFEANRGQADADVKFVGRGNGVGLLLKQDEAVLALRERSDCQDKTRGGPAEHSPASSCRLRMKLEGANSSPFVSGVQPQQARASYFIGNDPSKWIRGVETYSGVSYASVYRGVDLTFHGASQQLEYDFTVAPGADPKEIRLRFEGANAVELASGGALILHTPVGDLTHKQPVAYQETAGVRLPVAAEFRQFADGAIGFDVGDYDRARPLVIDPVLVYSTYVGGSASDQGTGIVVDSNGNSYITGDSFSSDFLFRASTTNSDLFIGKLSSNGLLLTYSFLGGAKNDTATGLAVDASGNLYLCGTTESADFPLLNSVGTALLGASDAFVIKLTPSFQQFFYSSLVGGSGDEKGVGIAIDSSGSAYIAGRTSSHDFPVVGAIQPSYGGGDFDAFVAKLAADGKTLVYSSFLGGSGTEDSAGRSGISVDGAGNAYVTGDTQSTNFPTRNPLQSTKSGAASSSDAFVSVINPTGSGFVYSTYLGGTSDDSGSAIANDQFGNTFVTGRTRSTSFPGSPSTRPSSANSDAFVAKLNPAGSAIVYLTFVGGINGNESANAIAVDPVGDAVIAGTAGDGSPTVNSIQSFFKGGQDDAFVAKLGASGAVTFSTYLGGSGDDVALAVGLGGDGAIYTTGFTDSTDFLTVVPLRGTNSGAQDIFIAKIDPNASTNRPVFLQALISGKKLILYGQNFQVGAVLRLNDEPERTANSDPDPSQVLVAKKAAKHIASGQTVQLQIENADGRRSNLLFLTKP